MIIMSAAIDECYRYGSKICQFVGFTLIAPLRYDTHVAMLAPQYSQQELS